MTASAANSAIEHLSPDGLYPAEKLGFTHTVTARARRIVWIAGQTACDERGRPVGGSSLALQADVALSNLGKALAAAGLGPADVTAVRTYVVGLNRERALMIAPRFAEFFAGVNPPASTWVGVTSLVHEDFLIEIEAEAVSTEIG